MTASQETINIQNIHLFYKNLGETPLESIQRFKKENPFFEKENITYAGRLDPIAEGLLILLSGEALKNKDDFLDLDKIYEFEVLWGFSTDTGDLLGKILNSKFEILKKEDIKKFLKESVGKFEQSYPEYSSKPVNGKPLFVWAREGKIKDIVVPKHFVKMLEGEFLERKEIKKEELITEIEKRIDLVNGDFRQQEIKNNWQEEMSKTVFDTFFLDKIRVKVSSGFYIRQFVLDMGKHFNSSLVTFSIKRIKVGDFYIADIKE